MIKVVSRLPIIKLWRLQVIWDHIRNPKIEVLVGHLLRVVYTEAWREVVLFSTRIPWTSMKLNMVEPIISRWANTLFPTRDRRSSKLCWETTRLNSVESFLCPNIVRLIWSIRRRENWKAVLHQLSLEANLQLTSPHSICPSSISLQIKDSNTWKIWTSNQIRILQIGVISIIRFKMTRTLVQIWHKVPVHFNRDISMRCSSTNRTPSHLSENLSMLVASIIINHSRKFTNWSLIWTSSVKVVILNNLPMGRSCSTAKVTSLRNITTTLLITISTAWIHIWKLLIKRPQIWKSREKMLLVFNSRMPPKFRVNIWMPLKSRLSDLFWQVSCDYSKTLKTILPI
jgi:hypothetical protein